MEKQEKIRQYERALETWGVNAQFKMLVEEVGARLDGKALHHILLSLFQAGDGTRLLSGGMLRPGHRSGDRHHHAAGHAERAVILHRTSAVYTILSHLTGSFLP